MKCLSEILAVCLECVRVNDDWTLVCVFRLTSLLQSSINKQYTVCVNTCSVYKSHFATFIFKAAYELVKGNGTY